MANIILNPIFTLFTTIIFEKRHNLNSNIGTLKFYGSKGLKERKGGKRNMNKLKGSLYDIRDGIRLKFPPCCIIQFALDTLTNTNPLYPKQIFRHIRGIERVPCSLHMWVYHQTKERALKELVEDSGIDLDITETSDLGKFLVEENKRCKK